MERVAVYIDGFNLYYGMKSKGWQRYYWLDLRLLSNHLLRSYQELELVRYFTAKVVYLDRHPEQQRNQHTYLEALETLPGLEIHYGYFLEKKRSCWNCGRVDSTYEEKMTDVNIAVQLLSDAQDDVFDTAIVMSADSDLAGPVKSLRSRYSDKKVVVAFPPRRYSNNLVNLATGYLRIGQDKLRRSQFPDQVHKSDGRIMSRPSNWR